MILDLCNIFDDINFDTFFKIRIIEATQLPKFNHLHSKEEIITIINSLELLSNPKVLDIPFLPEKFSISNATRTNNGNTIYSTRLGFPILPMDSALKDLLETYNNKLVVAFVIKHTSAHLYATSMQPLLFTYDELHANTNSGLKGYNISLVGENYGAPIYFTNVEQDILPNLQTLAFELAGEI